MKDAITKSWLKEKSNALNIPFAELLKGIMIEDFLYRVIPGERSVRFVLEKDDFLGEEAYRKGQESVISFYMKADLSLASEVLIQRLSEQGDFEWEFGELSKLSPETGRIMVTGHLEDMKVPLVISLSSRGDHPIYMDLKSYRGLIHRDTLDYSICAPEQKLAECIYMILNRLELIHSMEYYDVAYEITKSFAVDGRRVGEEFHREWVTNMPEGIVEKIRAYGDYRYMEKRWISYLKNKAMKDKANRNNRVEMPEWKAVLETICTFFAPIYESLRKDEIFIGDWMPELGRFM